MTGIYILTSPSGKNYVGQSINIQKRLNDLEQYIIPLSTKLKGKIAWNKGLKGKQVAWNKGLKMTPKGVS